MMLNILLWSLVSAIIACIPSVVGMVVFKFKEDTRMYSRKEFMKSRTTIGTVFFISDFIWMFLFLYISCKAITPVTMISWMWPTLLINTLVVLGLKGRYTLERVTSIVLTVVTVIMIFSSMMLAPVQKLLYVHDMQDVNLTYTISSDEILAKMDINIFNGAREGARNKYSIGQPEMRRINGKDVAVYHISNLGEDVNHSEYIPGFVIKEKDKMPEIISKRIYFDTSYVNSKDALRTVRRKYPAVYIFESKFDVDDDYNPYQIYGYREKMFSSNGKDYGIIILNLCDGTSEKYLADKIPEWVDFKTTYPR